MRRESIPISTAASQFGPLGQGLGGSLLLILHYFGAKESILSIMIITLSGITIAFLIFLRPQYRNILQSSLLKRQLNPSDFARILAGPEGEKIVSETLQSDNTEAVAFILTFLKEVNSTPFLPQIRKLVFSKSEEIAVLSLQLYRAVYRNRIFETISAQILGKDETLKARALDLLEISLNREDADRIIPLAGVLFPEEPSNEGTLSEPVRTMLLSGRNIWLHTITESLMKEKEKISVEKKNGLDHLEIISRISFLKKVDLFQNVPGDYLASIVELLKEKSYYEGEILFKKGDPGDAFYLIKTGKISILSEDKEVAVILPGQGTGEMSLIDGEPRSATALIKEDSELFRLSSADFHKLLNSYTSITISLLKTLSQRSRSLLAKDSGKLPDRPPESITQPPRSGR